MAGQYCQALVGLAGLSWLSLHACPRGPAPMTLLLWSCPHDPAPVALLP